MTIYLTSESFQKLISKAGFIDDLYDAMRREDLDQLPLIALKILEKTNKMPAFKKERKSDVKSASHREEGNKEYAAGNFELALNAYNKALLYAPDNSTSLKLAYSNRSALFFRMKAFVACLKDINTCCDLGCPADIVDKLEKRKENCLKDMWQDTMQNEPFASKVFKFNIKRSKDIPCASTHVEVIRQSGMPKVVAAKNIKLGTVIAVEVPYVRDLGPDNQYMSCYHCHSMPLNLIPCSNCCFALFCSKECRVVCLKQLHEIECQLPEVYEEVCLSPMTRMIFKAVVKMKLKCKSWTEFTREAYKIGAERLRTSLVSEIYDSNNNFCVLSFAETREAKFGSMYNYSFVTALLINCFASLPSFLPQSPDDRIDAIHALGRVFIRMFLFFNNNVDVFNAAYDKAEEKLHQLPANHACLAFTGRLRHDCEANLVRVGLNDRVALLAIHPIRRGAELTISYVDHTYEHMALPVTPAYRRRAHLYRMSVICHCPICDDTWTCLPKPKLVLQQALCFKKWLTIASTRGDLVFKATCDILTLLRGLPYAQEYKTAYTKLRELLIIAQNFETGNFAPLY